MRNHAAGLEGAVESPLHFYGAPGCDALFEFLDERGEAYLLQGGDVASVEVGVSRVMLQIREGKRTRRSWCRVARSVFELGLCTGRC